MSLPENEQLYFMILYLKPHSTVQLFLLFLILKPQHPVLRAHFWQDSVDYVGAAHCTEVFIMQEKCLPCWILHRCLHSSKTNLMLGPPD